MIGRAVREFFVDAEKVKEIRAMTGLSQTKFARLLDADSRKSNAQ